ncbi:MAG: hypothetical protein HOH77_04365 [Candidatus Latescibacteria bacterium]|jgi:hypothetical protein|nr:hypothetical protein [Candidatus Latescibacterota bacterium]
MKKLTFLASALALTLAFGEAQIAQAQDTAPEASFVDENGDGIDDNVRRGHRRGHRGIIGRAGANLSDEQKTELKALVDGLKAAEASKADVHAAVEAKFTEWGIELPERPTVASRLGDAISVEQAAELTALVDGLKEAETDRADIKAAVDAQLETWGIEKPEKPEGNKRGRSGRRGGRRGHFGPPPGAEAPADAPADAQ